MIRIKWYLFTNVTWGILDSTVFRWNLFFYDEFNLLEVFPLHDFWTSVIPINFILLNSFRSLFLFFFSTLRCSVCIFPSNSAKLFWINRIVPSRIIIEREKVHIQFTIPEDVKDSHACACLRVCVCVCLCPPFGDIAHNVLKCFVNCI